MLKMTMELAKTFQYNPICLLDKHGRHIETLNGEKPGDLYLLGHGYMGHTIYGIYPGCNLADGVVVISLDIWIEE